MLGLGMMVLLSRRSYDRDAGIVRRWYFLLLMMVMVVVDMLGGGSKMIRGVSAHIHGPANVTLISMFPSSPWRSKLKKKTDLFDQPHSTGKSGSGATWTFMVSLRS